MFLDTAVQVAAAAVVQVEGVEAIRHIVVLTVRR